MVKTLCFQRRGHKFDVWSVNKDLTKLHSVAGKAKNKLTYYTSELIYKADSETEKINFWSPKEKEGGISEEFEVSRCKQSYREWINKVLLYSIHACLLGRSVVSDSATSWTVACQASLAMEFSRQE